MRHALNKDNNTHRLFTSSSSPDKTIIYRITKNGTLELFNDWTFEWERVDMTGSPNKLSERVAAHLKALGHNFTMEVF